MSLIERILPPAWNNLTEETFVLEDWRHWFGSVMSLIFLALLPLVFVVDFPYFLDNKHYALIAVDVAVWLLLLARTLFPSSKYIYSRFLWLAVIYVMAVSFLVVLGPTYARSAWLVFCVVMTALFFGPKAALIMSLFNGLLIMALYMLMDPADPAWAETFKLGFNHWLVFAVSASLLSFGASIPVGFLLVRLDKALRRAKAANEELATERMQLGQAHAELQKQMREKALAQMALMESEEKLRLMADNLPNTVIYQVVADADGARRFVYMSRTVERMNEVTAEEVMADAGVMYSQVAPECMAELAAKETAALESLTTFRHTIRSILPSGKVRWFDLAATPRQNKDGSVTWDGVQVDVTEREQAKQALRDSENLYRTLVENSHAGISMADDKYRYVYVNDEFCRILGFEPGELLGMDARELWAEETFQIVNSHYQARQRGENPPSHYDMLMHRKDGEKRWLEVRASVITDTAGRVRTMGQFLDITERKKAEDALRESEELYRVLVENSHAGIAMVDDAYRYIYVNEEFCRILGFEQDELLGMDVRELWAEETFQIVNSHYLARQRGEEPPPHYEVLMLRKDGVKRWLEVRASVITDATGMKRTVAQFIDITERKRAEDALRESEALHRAVVENSHDGIVLVDREYHLTYVNDEFCLMTGYPREEMVGQDFRQFLAEETAHITVEHYEARLRGEEPPPVYEFLIKRKGGQKRLVEVKSSEIMDAKGEIFLVGQLLDITERHEAEQALRQSESLYRSLVEHSHAGIGLLDDSFCFNYVNDELCQISGYTREELLGMDGRNLVAAESVEELAQNFRARRQGEPVPERYNIVGVRKDGEKRWIELSSSIIIDSNGDVCTLSQFLDITERKNAEDALRQSENLYRALVEHSHAGIVLIDDQHRYEYVNDEYCRILGYEREEIVGQDFRRFLAPETAHLPTEHYLARQRGENPPAHYEYLVVRKDGNKRWMEVSASVITDPKGKVHTVAQLLDVTERKKAGDALRASETLYRALAENSHAGIVLIDSSYRFTYMNSQFCNIMGYTREEMLGEDFRKFMAPETAHVPEEHYLARQRGENPPARYEFMVVRKDGAKRWLETSSSIITGADGEKSTLAQNLDITERKLSEEALRQSENLYRALAENSHAGIVLVGDSYRIIYANSELCQMTGYSNDELVGEEYGLIVAEEYKPLLAEYYQTRRRGEAPPSRYEFLMRRNDGTKRWVEASVGMFANEQGEIFILAQLLDVTERKMAEEALRQSEQRFRASFDSAFQFAGLLTPEGRVLEANQTALDFIGATLDDVVGSQFWKAPWWRGRPEQQQRIKDAIRRAVAGEVVRFEAENIGQDHEKIYVDFSIKPIYDSEGKVVMLLPEGHDITGRVEALEALRQSEEKFRQVIQSSPMGTFMYELETPDRLVFMGANPAADRILQLDTNEFLGKTLEEVFPLIAETDLPRRMRNIAARGTNPIKNEPIEYSDGRIKGFFELHIFQTAPGKIAVMFQDVAERRKAEEERARLESQLRQSQKMEAVGTLTSGIAHDFNNILGAILGITEASLLKGNDLRALISNFGSIRDMSIRGRDLVRRLLSFSRQDEQIISSLDIAELVDDSIELIKATLPANVTVKKRLSRGLTINADPVQMQQVLLNLCTNAAHAMEEKGGVLSISLSAKNLSQNQAKLHHGLEAGPHVLIEVSDTGAGISQHVQERIFDPFFTTKPMGRGTGLGLSLVHGIIMSHHGAITVSSKEGAGTTMSLLLPRETGAGVYTEEPQDAAPMEGRGEHIMVVDDEEIIARSAAQTLEALGYRVSAYTSALEAAAALENDPKRYDAILTDHMMPGLTGRQLAEIAAELNPDLPVVLMTGMYGEAVNSGQAGEVAKILTKPVTVKEIGQAVRQVLDSRGAQDVKALA